jgi:hypothetical protein
MMALMLAGCAGEPVAAPAPKLAITMAGRWILSAPNAPSCSMTFEGAPGQKQGAIHPEGGCPGKFFTSRSWALSEGRLTIDDYKNRPLAELELAKGGFQGKSTAGMPVTLAR